MTMCYRCEKCGKIYDSEQECRECEGIHAEPLFLATPRWAPKGEYPGTIRVAFGNGTSRLYALRDCESDPRHLAGWQIMACMPADVKKADR